MSVFKFLDLILTLNKQYEVQYVKQAKKIDEERKMSVMLTPERLGFEKGAAEMLTNQLKAKFQDIPEEYLHKISEADVRTLNKWGINLVLANSLEDVFRVQ